MLAEFIKLPKEGETIGPYFLRQRLSTCILGSFFKAMHKGLHEEVVIHIIPEALHRADPKFEGRYREAIQKQSTLPDGPVMKAAEISRVLGSLIVRYEEKGQLRSFNDLVFKRKGKLPEERVREILFSMADGLGQATKIDQGHYFMTPDFLFLNEEDEVRIAGVGIFQSIQYEAFERFVSGTLIPISVDKSKSFSALEILSPEIRNFKTRDHRSDFFCIGMCAYFLLLGRKPERRWDLPSKVRSDIGDGWDLFISNCLEPRPVDRFPNYRAFTRDLENIEDLTGTPRREGGRLLRILNHIPLPRSIENALGLRTLLTVRLVLLVLFGILSVGTAAILKQILVSDLGAGDTRTPVRMVMEESKANIILNVNPGDALVVVTGRQSGRFKIKNGVLMLKGSSGRYRIMFSSDRRRSDYIDIDLKASDPQSFTVNLPYNFSTVHAGGVIGTKIYVEGEDDFLQHIGTIDSDEGLTISDKILAGTYDLIARHDNYVTVRVDALNFGRNATTVEFEQEAKPTSLTLTSSPEGAGVFIEGVKLGETPLVIEGIEAGRPMEVAVALQGYREYRQLVEFSVGQSIHLDLGELVLKEGRINYTIDLSMEDAPDLREMAFSVDQVMKKLQENGELVLPEGKRTIVVEHPDYYPFTEEIMVKDEDSMEVVISLEPRPVRLTPLVWIENPSRFRVDGKDTPLTEGGYLPLPPNKQVTVEAIIRDHMDVVQTFQGKPNERLDWDVPLRPIPGPVLGESWRLPYFSMRMAWADPGRYNMGSPPQENRRVPNEDNLTDVRLDTGFWVSETEVTQGVFLRVMGTNPSHFEGEQLPVDSVTYAEAVEFCARLNIFEGRAGRLPDGYAYRLPTEAEWEYVTRAGTDTPFSFGENADPSLGNFQGTYTPERTEGNSPSDRYGTLEVGSFLPNAWGLYDVHGNVAEWTLDRFWDRHPGGSILNPYNNERGRGHPLRGGSWEDDAYDVRSASRKGVPASSRRNSIGFRVVLAPFLGE